MAKAIVFIDISIAINIKYLIILIIKVTKLKNIISETLL